MTESSPLTESARMTESSRLLTWSQVPPHARNAYVLHGYRPVLGYRAPSTIFQMHNETANVWSHILAFWWMVPRVYYTFFDPSVDAAARTSILIFQCSAAWCFAASSCAHAFASLLPLEASRRLWRWDLSAICLCIGGSSVPGIRWGFRCHPVAQRVYAAVLSMGTLTSLWLSNSPLGSRRHKLFVAAATTTVTFCLLPLVHWSYGYSTVGERRTILPSALWMFSCYLIGFIFFRYSPLERLWPAGVFDYFGSHCVWHLAGWCAVAWWDHACHQLTQQPWDGSDCKSRLRIS